MVDSTTSATVTAADEQDHAASISARENKALAASSGAGVDEAQSTSSSGSDGVQRRGRQDDSISTLPQPQYSAGNLSLRKTKTIHLWKFRFRPQDDDEGGSDWWFASTAIPLLAATIGPLANVLSIAALVSYWRMNLGPDGAQLDGKTFKDPHWYSWVYYPNLVSLITGYVGNLFLLANFTNRIRYIVALPATIFLWFISAILLTSILCCLHVYQPPGPGQTYTQGFWHGVIAAVLYLICALILMINMIGYFLGHYPQHFNLTEAQRTLILQSMLFFIWLAGGAAVFSSIEGGHQPEKGGWSFSDALYFCDVTILTVGFGDLTPVTNGGRGLVFPYSVGGIIMLGLMIGSISNFASEMSRDKIIKKHIESKRQQTVERSKRRLSSAKDPREIQPGQRPSVSSPFNGHAIPVSAVSTIGKQPTDVESFEPPKLKKRPTFMEAVQATGKVVLKATPVSLKKKKPRAIQLREEKDRFDAMRKIQRQTSSFKNWTALTASVIAFGLLWAVGAVVFWQCEKDVQGMTYFQALYFCYVSLLTIGYGDLAPQSNAGRPFFVVWSLFAVPTMTILVNDMGSTVISKFKHGTNILADFTILPKYGIWRNFLSHHPWLLLKLQRYQQNKEARKRLREGFQTGPDPDLENVRESPPTLEELASSGDKPEDEHDLARKLALAIRRTANDLKADQRRRYTYEEWVEFTQLIRFSSHKSASESSSEDEEGLVEWDWIGENSPMMVEKSEPEFVLDRLCESMARYIKHQGAAVPPGPSSTSVSNEAEKVATWDATDGADEKEHTRST